MNSSISFNNFESERYIEVDAARLLLILHQFSVEIDEQAQQLKCFPYHHPVVRYFTPEYRLQKIDFLVRYPTYFAYELIELHCMGESCASDRHAIIRIVRDVLENQEPELMTDLYRKFLRGAYERLDQVESWWHSRRLVFRGLEGRGTVGSPARPHKYYFLTEKAEKVAVDLLDNVDHAKWYGDRIKQIHFYFGGFSAEKLKNLQYSHKPYRDAQLNEYIPDLPIEDLSNYFEQVFDESL
jgi:hypothetical protein